MASQLSLFGTHPLVDDRAAASARARMREMIDRLRATTVPFWPNEAAVILDDGAFQRAMRLVPAEEAQALWAEYNEHMERLYPIWAAAEEKRRGLVTEG
jgi:hypothetical protein